MKNYLKANWRNLRKNRGFSALNVAGLAVGLACSSLIFLWVEDELTFDHDVSKRHHIYRLMENQTHDGVINTFSTMPGPMSAVTHNTALRLVSVSFLAPCHLATLIIDKIHCGLLRR
jgi:hypothetical protein